MAKPRRRGGPKPGPKQSREALDAMIKAGREDLLANPLKALTSGENWTSKQLEKWRLPSPESEPVKRANLKALGKSLLRFVKAMPTPEAGLVVHGKKYALRIHRNPDGNIQVALIVLKANSSFNYIFDGQTGRYIKRAAINTTSSKPGIQGFELSNGPNPNILLTLVDKYRPLLVRELAKQRVKARRRKRPRVNK